MVQLALTKFVIHKFKRQICHKENQQMTSLARSVWNISFDFWYYLLCGEDNAQWLRSFARLNNTKMKLFFIIIMI